MKIETLIAQKAVVAIKELYGQEIDAATVQVQKTKREFEGHLTIVVFPYLKMSRKGPEQTATEIGTWLRENVEEISSYNVIKGFLNLVISSSVWVDMLNGINADENYGLRSATDDSPLVMIEYSSPNTNKPLHLGHVRNKHRQ